MIRRHSRSSLGVVCAACVALSAFLLTTSAHASIPQSTVKDSSAALKPKSTKTGHEIGATLNINIGPNAFIPRFNWRVQFKKTAAQGKLSGLFLGLGAGPSIGFRGGLQGNTGLNIGYEFDPWSNLALTFSPILHADFFYDSNDFRFMNTLGMVIRLYVRGHWVIMFEPAGFGWSIHGHGRGNDAHAGFAFRAGWGFAYKF
jgi:hypothetical protein